MYTLIATLVGLLAGAVAFGRPRRLPRLGHAAEIGLSDVSVVVPARNEAASLANLLLTMRPLAARLRSLIVVDDGSTDETAAIAASFPSVTVISAGEPPPGWVGKSWACATGAAASAGDTLVFVDADVRFAPNGLAEVVAAHRRRDAVISVQPHHEVDSFAEHASWLPNVVSFMAIGAGTEHPSALYGPVVCCSRAQYDAAGGHEAVRSAVAEDIELGRVLDERQVPYEVYAGGPSVSFRMYPNGFRQLVEGWTKNLASGATTAGMGRTAVSALWVYALLQAALSGLPMLAGARPLGGALLLTLAASSLWAMGRALGTFRWYYAPLFPIWATVFTLLVLRSWWSTTVRRSVRWRGRDIALTRRRDGAVEPS